MTDYVMPTPPEGTYWRVSKANMTRAFVWVELYKRKGGIVSGACAMANVTQDAEANADRIVEVAGRVLQRLDKMSTDIDVNGLSGATLGEGIVGRD